MAITRVGNILPNGNFIPKIWSKFMLATYLADNVVPQVTNHDYEGEIQNVGDTVGIRKEPDIEIFTGKRGEALKRQQSLADEAINLTIDYFDYFNVPVYDIDRVQTDINYAERIFGRAARNLGTVVERRVLQTVYASASSTVTQAALDATNVIKFFMQAKLALIQKNVPQDEGMLWAVIDPITAYFAGLSDLKYAHMTGEGSTSMRTGWAVDKPVAGFKVYISNNLLATAGLSHCLFGHMDAITFAAQINDNETIRDQTDFADLLRGKIVYGFKVQQPDALVHGNVTSFAAL